MPLISAHPFRYLKLKCPPFCSYYFNSRMHGGDRNDLSSPLDLVFPKVTMCEFWEHGQTGQHQTCSATCILPLNIVNEKLYIVLWFWYVFIIAMSLLVVIYRIVSFTTKALRRYVERDRKAPERNSLYFQYTFSICTSPSANLCQSNTVFRVGD